MGANSESGSWEALLLAAKPRKYPEDTTPLVLPGCPDHIRLEWARLSAVGPEGLNVVSKVAARTYVDQDLGLFMAPSDHNGHQILETRAMYAPGRILHVRRIGDHESTSGRHRCCGPTRYKTSNCKGALYEAIWVPREELGPGKTEGLGSRFLFPNAMRDHFPWRIIEALGEAAASPP